MRSFDNLSMSDIIMVNTQVESLTEEEKIRYIMVLTNKLRALFADFHAIKNEPLTEELGDHLLSKLRS